MTTYIVTASVQIEVAGEALTDNEIAAEARRRFFSEIETYKQDEVAVEIVEEIED